MGFTRITVQARDLGIWRLGRAGDAYELKLDTTVTTVDLERAFARIGRDRVAGLSYDTTGHSLRFDLACDCFAMAFNVGRGLIAIDFFAGKAPANSPFEYAFDPTVPAWSRGGLVAPNLWQGGAENSGLAHYDWLEVALQARRQPLPEQRAETPVDPLRDALLRQISRAIAQGVIEPSPEPLNTQPGPDALDNVPALRVVIGEIPGLSLSDPRGATTALNHKGQACVADEAFDFASWVDGNVPAYAQLGPLRDGMLGEFDQPAPEAVLRAAKGFLAFGFGAEAREILALSSPNSGGDQKILLGLSHLIDLEPDPHNTFINMENCDTSVALWAMLHYAVTPNSGTPSFPNNAAVTRSFSALSLDMRRYIGPVLAQYYIERGDTATAQTLREAVMRAPGHLGGEVILMDAALELAKGQPERASGMASQALDKSAAQAAQAAILMAESAFAGRQIVSQELAATLAVVGEGLSAGAETDRLWRARMLTAAMLGRFEAAFEIAEKLPQFAPDLWSLAAENAPDDILLAKALDAAQAQKTFDAQAHIVAKRLMQHGFSDAALTWLGALATTGGAESRLLAAQAALDLRDARLAYAILAGLTGEEAQLLRAKAAMRLGDMERALALLPPNADNEQRLLQIMAGQWDTVAQDGREGWRDAARLSLPSAPPAYDEGPLAAGKRLTLEAEETRDAIKKLMMQTDF